MVNTERIVNKVMEAYKRKNITGLTDWLEKLGCKRVEKNKESAVLIGLTGMRVGFILSDPCTLAICTGFALFGPFWAQLCPELLKEVNKRWKKTQQGR